MNRQTLDTGTKEAAREQSMTRRDRVAVAVFGTWMITGLFLDGWSHGQNKPESFFSPWHGVLYSGFGAAVLFFAWDGRRRGRVGGPDRLTSAGLALFLAGAGGDFLWHEVFGIEADLAALLSPTHLLLMSGGMLMVSAPVRAAWADDPDAPSFSLFVPTLLTLTLATALASFFLMYASAFGDAASLVSSTQAKGDESLQVVGIASILVTNVLLMAPVLLVLRRFRPPFGTFTLLFGTVAVAMTGLDGFERLPLAAAALAGGVAGDLVARALGPRAVGGFVPLVMWPAWFGVVALVWGVRWEAELWTGSIALAVLSGLGLSLLVSPPRRA